MSRGKSKSTLLTKEGELKNQLARALADYDNLRKRIDNEREVWIHLSSERVLIKLFPVLDILESAQNHLKDQGLEIGLGEFKKILFEEAIEEIRPNAGDHFNPEIHEAVEVISGGKKGTIAELVLVGWKYREGKVLRIAKVKVFN